MKFLIPGLLFLGALLIQHTFASFMAIFDVKPNFIVIYLVVLSLKFGRFYGSLTGFVMGAIEDGVFTVLFGLNAFCKSFVGFLAQSLPTTVLRTAFLNTGLILFMASLMHDFLFHWIYAFGSGTSAVFLLFRYALPGAIYTALIGAIIWAIFPNFLGLQDERQ